MFKKNLFIFCAFMLVFSSLSAQDDLLEELNENTTDSSYEMPAFKSYENWKSSIYKNGRSR